MLPETCMSAGQISEEDESTGAVSSRRICENKEAITMNCHVHKVFVRPGVSQITVSY